MVSIMARPRKAPTGVARMPLLEIVKHRRLAKLMNMSFPDYIKWKLNK